MRFKSEASKFKAVVKRDKEADSHFFYGVKTTKIFCRPSCSSREPKRENTVFFFTCKEAEDHGFRACKRCSPKEHDKDHLITQAITKACRLIEDDPNASLEEIAKEAGFSPFHFHRLFKRQLGLTPKQYSTQCKTNLYGKLMKKSLHVTYDVAQCSLGFVMVTLSSKGIYTIELGDSEESLLESFKNNHPAVSIEREASNSIHSIVRQIDDPTFSCNLPLDIQGTAFQQRVWQELQRIAVGETASYSEVAKRIGNPSATRAVARACATNKIAILIPCHRVIRSDGSNSGYRWGMERKNKLLENEKKSS